MSLIADFLAQRFEGRPTALAHYAELLSAYEASGLAPPNVIDEITSGNEGKFCSHVWEAMLYRHLSNLGFQFRRDRVKKSGQHGPDFGLTHEGRTIWIEAVVPAPEGIPPEYLEPPTNVPKVRTVPHEKILLRWTAALKDKRDQLDRYVREGIIAPTDCSVVAINSRRLSWFPVEDNGITQLPYAVEAAFPVGPIAVPISTQGKPDGEPMRTQRYSIQKANGAAVPTANFLDPKYSNVSAIIGCSRSEMLKGLPVVVVHNPLTTTALPRSIMGGYVEYVAEPQGEDYLLQPLHAPASSVNNAASALPERPTA